MGVKGRGMGRRGEAGERGFEGGDAAVEGVEELLLMVVIVRWGLMGLGRWVGFEMGIGVERRGRRGRGFGGLED